MMNVFNILPHGQVWRSPGQPGWAVSCWPGRPLQASCICRALCSPRCLTASCLFSETLPGGVCLSHWLLLSLRDTVSPLSPLDPLRWTVSKKAVRFLVPVQLMVVQRLPISSWEAECRSQGGMWASKGFPGEALYIDSMHTDSGFHFLKSRKCWWYEGKIKQDTGKSKSLSAHWPPVPFPGSNYCY